MTEQMVVQLGPEEELEAAMGAVVGSQSSGSSVLLEHVPLKVRRGREEASAQVASESRTARKGVLDEVSLELEGRVEGSGAESARMEGTLGEEMTGHMGLDLGLAPENLLALDALVPPGRRNGLVHQLTVDLEAVLANVGLLPARSHPVRDELSGFQVPMAEAAGVQIRLLEELGRCCPAPVRVETGVKAHLEGQVEGLTADEAREGRSGVAGAVRRCLKVGVVGLLRGQRDAALGADGRTGHFAVGELVLGQH